jgi:hypothetical protein
MDAKDFYQQCAIAAMQGLMENGKVGLVADLTPTLLAKKSFDIADAMLKEYKENRADAHRNVCSKTLADG